MSEAADRFKRRANTFERLAAGVPPDRWTAQSPCEAWDARGVVGHVIDMLGVLLGAIDRQLTSADLADPLQAFRSARADVEPPLSDPEIAGRVVTSPAGTMPFEQLSDVFGGDLVWHGWDLAMATGQDATIDPDEVLAGLTTAEQLPPEMYEPEAFGPGVVVFGPKIDVPHDAPAQDRLLGLFGRDPDWTPIS